MNHYSVEHISFLSVNHVNTINGVIYVPDSQPKGIVQISHGMCEYIGRYDRFMGFLADRGYLVAGHDHLGHGQSSEEAEYGYFGAKDGYKNLVEDLPILLISGDMDPVGNYGKGVKKVYDRLNKAGINDVSMILYPGARHEILNEINYQEVYMDVEDWIRGRTGAQNAQSYQGRNTQVRI